MKFNPNIHMVIVFCVAFLAAAVLVGMGKLDQEYLKYFMVWLAPAPFSFDPGQPSGTEPK